MTAKYEKQKSAGEIATLKSLIRKTASANSRVLIDQWCLEHKDDGYKPGDKLAVGWDEIAGGVHDVETLLGVEILEWRYQWNAGGAHPKDMTWTVPKEFSDKTYRTLSQYTGTSAPLKTSISIEALCDKFVKFMGEEKSHRRVQGGTLSILSFLFKSKSGRVYCARLHPDDGRSGRVHACVYGNNRTENTTAMKMEVESEMVVGDDQEERHLPKTIENDEEFSQVMSIRQDLGEGIVRLCPMKPTRKALTIVTNPCEMAH